MKLAQHNLNLGLIFTLVFENSKKGIQIQQFAFTTNWGAFCGRLDFDPSANN